MDDDVDVCGRCGRLDVKSHPDQLKLGRGYCLMHGPGSPSRPQFAAWNDHPCVLFVPASPMAPRGRWIEKWQAKQQNEVQTETKG